VDEAIVDANILLRLLTNEPRDLADRVEAILERASASNVRLRVNSITLAEVVYVLASFYKWNRDGIADRLSYLVTSSKFWFPEEAILLEALRWYKSVPQLHFADAYVASVALMQQHGAVLSFDREFRRIPGLAIIQDANDIE
jgi:predicted nucleic acid-binding protein